MKGSQRSSSSSDVEPNPVRRVEESHEVSPHQYLSGDGYDEKVETDTPIGQQVTIRLRYKLVRSQMIELALCFLGEVIHDRDLRDEDLYISNFLYQAILGRRRQIKELPNKSDQEVARLLGYLITTFGFRAAGHNIRRLNGDLVGLISRTLVKTLSKRAHGSRRTKWASEKFVECRVENLLTNVSGRSSTPYDSYCKGYGEGGKPIRSKHSTSQVLDRTSYNIEPPPRKFYKWPSEYGEVPKGLRDLTIET